ncbi:[protein-PII] uridylyltransferase [Pseudoalteromonas denitrificans]|uniref:Bifunctional uridylyltransferase/uridylyl-removing enzyme n=1 Tax=Pseudoalteromonas denitrificans DSM 6059 TaxID=1123010 RepID=A0A1I1HIN5_9GAMM|nr:[protein-PII] uridylyltransferase [Pseudoalteromonas denitrificans]SFC21313.1 UTP--GlnB (protein PII) uridylyltransferase, GlnD [Pseudoalteromonas denitrificans DSM 6059]
MAVPEIQIKQLAQCELLEDYKNAIADFYLWLKQEFSYQPVERLIKARACYIDQLLCKLFQGFGLANNNNLTLIAVGGYGRGELHPYSDIDFLLLVQKEPTTTECEKISQFVTMLWDLGLDIGHSVRTLEQTIDYEKQDVSFATSLLESRLIYGSEENFNLFQTKLIQTKTWNSEDFFLAKTQEQDLRHKKCHGTTYNLEPNLKENPGGLRDIQTIIWVAKKHFKSQSLSDLITDGYLTYEEHQELLECLLNLWNIRFALHLASGRAENRLLFDHQPLAAELLGFGSDGKASVERMMKRLFRIMSRIRELNQMLLRYFDHSILPDRNTHKIEQLNDDFVRVDHQVKVEDPSVFFNREKIFELFEHIANNPKITHIHPSTLRTLRQVRRRLLGDLQDYAACRTAFLRLLKHPNGMGRAFTLMHKHGILAAYLPQWRNIFGQMQFDLFHAYTVDEHTHKVIQNIHHYFSPQSETEFPLCREIVVRMEKPELLYLAGIFHDIAKGRGGDHSELGALDTIEFAKLHQFSDFEGKFIAWLVENHLLMSVTAQRKDITDPDVINEFAKRVKNEKRLNYLYCLTLADIRATNDNLWNSWKNTLLRELFLSTRRALRLGLENPMDLRDQIRDKKRQAKQDLLNLNFNEAQIDFLWNRFKADYFTRFSALQISWHSQHLLEAKDLSQPVVIVSEKAMHGGTQVFVYSPDKINLFARLVSFLGNKKTHIHYAQVMVSKDGYAIDSFVILEKNGSAIESPSRISSIKRGIEQSLKEPNKKIRIKKTRSKRFKGFNIKPQVIIRSHGRKDRTLIEIQAVDIPGLLTKIANVFQKTKLHIHAARITTIGERAEDFFVVSDAQYQALAPEIQAKISHTLLESLNKETE